MKESRKQVQLEFNFLKEEELDRNYDKGGRSFYFFDFDDNIMNLLTQIVLFHKETKKEILISSHELASDGAFVGKSGRFKDYYFDYDDAVGSFRNFRDKKYSWVQKNILGKEETFVKDLKASLKRPFEEWKGPSWNYFYHATFNKRPISIITARGHYPETIKDGIKELWRKGLIANLPNYLAVYPVSNRDMRISELNDSDLKMNSAELKKVAIKKSVEKAVEIYGNNPYHRFGMSDDDPKNIQLIIEAMKELKEKYPLMSFFVIDTHDGYCLKKEIFQDYLSETCYESYEELNFLPKE